MLSCRQTCFSYQCYDFSGTREINLCKFLFYAWFRIEISFFNATLSTIKYSWQCICIFHKFLRFLLLNVFLFPWGSEWTLLGKQFRFFFFLRLWKFQDLVVFFIKLFIFWDLPDWYWKLGYLRKSLQEGQQGSFKVIW